MDTNMLHELKDILCVELQESVGKVRKGGMSRDALGDIDKLTHSLKSVETILAMQESGYSNDYQHRGYQGARYGGSAYDSSYRGRDSMGRYTSSDGFSEELQRLMDKAPNQNVRMEMERLMQQMGNR